MPDSPHSLVGHLDRDGDVRTLILGPPPLLSVEVILGGSTVAIVDPSAPTPSVRLIVTDCGGGTGAVGRILGEPALEALWGDDDLADFPVTPGVGLAALQRLALLDWLRWDCPRTMDPELLDLERAVALWDLLTALDDGLEEAEVLGRGRTVQRLIAEVGLFATEDRPAVDGLLRPLLASVVDGFVRENAGTTAQRHKLRRQQQTLRAVTGLTADSAEFDRALTHLLEAVAHATSPTPAREPALLAFLNGPESQAAESVVGAEMVDLVQIPRMLRGILSSDADAVRWTIPPNGPILVSVARQSDGPVDDLPKPFTARLVDNVGSILASAPLRESSDGLTFVARIERPAQLADPAEVWVDVTIGDRLPPAHGAALSSRLGRHRAGWAFAEQRRQLLLSQVPDGRASEAGLTAGAAARQWWQEAASRFSSSGEDDLADLADDRAAQVRQVVEPTAGLRLTLAEVDAAAAV